MASSANGAGTSASPASTDGLDRRRARPRGRTPGASTSARPSASPAPVARAPSSRIRRTSTRIGSMIWSICVKAAGNQSYSTKRATRPSTARQSLMSVPPMSMPQMAVPSMPLVASLHSVGCPLRCGSTAWPRATRRPGAWARTLNVAARRRAGGRDGLVHALRDVDRTAVAGPPEPGLRRSRRRARTPPTSAAPSPSSPSGLEREAAPAQGRDDVVEARQHVLGDHGPLVVRQRGELRQPEGEDRTLLVEPVQARRSGGRTPRAAARRTAPARS